MDFDGWQYLSRSSGGDPTTAHPKKPLVYFGSFQDLLGRDDAGNIKAKNEWLHTMNWDLVVFDEYHFARGAIRRRNYSRARMMWSQRKRPSWNTLPVWKE